jgi:hypothetical protein
MYDAMQPLAATAISLNLLRNIVRRRGGWAAPSRQPLIVIARRRDPRTEESPAEDVQRSLMETKA